MFKRRSGSLPMDRRSRLKVESCRLAIECAGPTCNLQPATGSRRVSMAAGPRELSMDLIGGASVPASRGQPSAPARGYARPTNRGSWAASRSVRNRELSMSRIVQCPPFRVRRRRNTLKRGHRTRLGGNRPGSMGAKRVKMSGSSHTGAELLHAPKETSGLRRGHRLEESPCA